MCERKIKMEILAKTNQNVYYRSCCVDAEMALLQDRHARG